MLRMVAPSSLRTLKRVPSARAVILAGGNHDFAAVQVDAALAGSVAHVQRRGRIHGDAAAIGQHDVAPFALQRRGLGEQLLAHPRGRLGDSGGLGVRIGLGGQVRAAGGAQAGRDEDDGTDGAAGADADAAGARGIGSGSSGNPPGAGPT